MPPRVHILAVGGLHRDLAPAFEHYRRLLGPHWELQVREVREVSMKGRAPLEVLREEGRRLIAAWPDAPTVAALTLTGRPYDSETFARAVDDWLRRGGLAFVIGGSLGLADEVVRRATVQVSLSSLTLPHQLARVVLAEQLFRSLRIVRGEPYHH